MMLEGESLEQALETLGRVLEQRGLEYEIVVVGGSALLLMGIIRRPTKDLDVLAVVRNGEYVTAQPLPEGLQQAVRDVAAGLGLASDWLNGGPTALIQSGLPEGFKGRVDTRTYRTLVVHIASRLDHIFLKVYAAASYWPHEEKHVNDLRRLAPTREELTAASRWARSQDVSLPFAGQLADLLMALGVEDVESEL